MAKHEVSTELVSSVCVKQANGVSPNPLGKEIAVGGRPEKTINEACQQGLLEEIKRYNENQLKELDENGWSALHYASRFNQGHIVEYLVNIGIDVNITTENDDATPLHLAVR